MVGRYNGTVPDVPEVMTQSKMRVILKDSSGNSLGRDESDGVFTITPSTGGGGQEQVIFGTEITDKAIRIENLTVNGTLYNVTFNEMESALGAYDEFPGDFDFTTEATASDAVDAVIAALNAENARVVGQDTTIDNVFNQAFSIGYKPDNLPVQAVSSIQGIITAGSWGNSGSTENPYLDADGVYAVFTEVP